MDPEYTLWMPDYFPAFSCKMGACRNACCKGWPIAFSLEEYFRLINESCSPFLRNKMDRGIRPALSPTPDRYAEIVPDYEGNCPMLLADGRCAIHAELGARALSDVCRLYPRGIRAEEDGFEISCANSCEAVLELFLSRREPIEFRPEKMRLAMPPVRKRTVFFETYGHEREIRLALIRVMQDRRLSLPERLMLLKRKLITAEAAMKAGETAVLDWIRGDAEDHPVLPEVCPERLLEGLKVAEKLIAMIDERSVSVREFGEEALCFFRRGEDVYERYVAAKADFETRFPDWALFFEHMLVNHMFFSCFPFEDRPEDLKTEYMALCTVYMLLRFLAIGCSGHCGNRQKYVDLFAAAFRLIDHTAFDIYVSHLLYDLKWTADKELLDWIAL